MGLCNQKNLKSSNDGNKSEPDTLKMEFNAFAKRIGTFHYLFNPFPNKPWFLRVCSISLLKKHYWKRRKNNFFSFSSNLKLSSVNSFSFEESKNCRLGKG